MYYLADFALETIRTRRVGQVKGHPRSVGDRFTEVSPHNRTSLQRGFGKVRTVLDKIKENKSKRKVW